MVAFSGTGGMPRYREIMSNTIYRLVDAICQPDNCQIKDLKQSLIV